MFLPECVHLDSDFCYIPNQMSYSHTWRNAPRRGLAVLSEDSKEEESDRDYVETKKKSREEPTRQINQARRFPRRLLTLILSTAVILLIIFSLYRYHSQLPSLLWKRTSPSVEKAKISAPRHKKPEEGLFCSNYSLLKLEEGGSYIYSLEATIPVNFSTSSEVFGFYTAFSEDGKLIESPRYIEITKNGRRNILWRTTQTGHLDSDYIVNHYVLTFFIENEAITKVIYKVFCSEREIRRVIEESATKQEEGRKAINDWIIQVLLYVFIFVIGVFVSRWLPIQKI